MTGPPVLTCAPRCTASDRSGPPLRHARLVDADGNTQHEISIDRMRDAILTVAPFTGHDILVLMPAGAAYSVWWFFRAGVFAGWYVNLEQPYVRRSDGVDTTDHVLDIVVTPQRQWEWKDTDEFTERIGNPVYFDQPAADAIRAEGERLVRLIEAGEFPFDGTYTDFRPDPDWSTLRLPPGLGRESARSAS
jgi:hypothetical protein